MTQRYWRDLVAKGGHGLWRGGIPVTREENELFDTVMRLAQDEEKLAELLAKQRGRVELAWRPVTPEIRAANKHEGQRKGGSVRGEQLATVRLIRRTVIEEFLFGPQGASDMQDDLRRHPQGDNAVKWLVDFFARLSRTSSLYPLGGASEKTVRNDITAILAKRRKFN